MLKGVLYAEREGAWVGIITQGIDEASVDPRVASDNTVGSIDIVGQLGVDRVQRGALAQIVIVARHPLACSAR